ncbi:MAG: 23S rRNA (adenine(2030)-N(6))-methyltransferase RlmJ [Hyphomicrobium sp.]|nr:23S rRNA (adenine(2030)-N(6))-methyltransferase RlmJ [Hyphomicrobium sp.]
MNYRHVYHAGNFADVLKHVILARIVTYLKLKPQPFRVIDLHAGAGLYDLTGEEAGKTGEWRDGIGRLRDADLEPGVRELLAPYLDTISAINGEGAVKFYPGSPLLARALMRDCDTLVANELHPDDAMALKSALRRHEASKVTTLDAWTAIKALLPPPERRGIVLIDPPFEQPDEFERMTDAIKAGLQRFASAVYIVWYPIKNVIAANDMVDAVTRLGCPKMLDVRLKIAEPFPGLGLTETGVLLLNPPFSLKDELNLVMPALAARLGQDRGAAFTVAEPGGND